ncbi:sensor domain-containing diguanylate cyclase [Syntrophomonas wolfei]|uniref:Response regulator receiver protein n=1 Tax=Syntrophomonas wolfei subsp. wolfei (strain DSM 2245B / Goettingen) TaxID=335541 RepID=Q0AV70_SYNWW|nr:diguanylate cyclase [Syntrophomonas wolfei]ABI69384.1 response regulator receiver protein [Syntrophomonas wolfei subsp. wolfei str. Goettingen G311]
MHFPLDFYQAVLENLNHGLAFFRFIIDWDREDRAKNAELVMVNPAFTKLTGLDKEEIMDRMLPELFPGVFDSRFDGQGFLENILLESNKERLEYYAKESGKWLLLVFFSPLPGILGVALHDISELETTREEIGKSSKGIPFELEQQEEKKLFMGLSQAISRNLSQEIFSHAFCLNPTLMSITAFDESIYLDVNESFLNTLGFSRDEVIGHSCSELGILSISQKKEIQEMLLKKGKIRNWESKFIAKAGEEVPGLLSVDLIQLRDKKLLLMVFHDITERIRMKEELEEKNQQLRELNRILQVQAITDSLTGLYNHRQVLEKLQLEIARANRYQQELTIMMLDIDHFKSINDEFGHQVGDVVLVEVAQIIKRNLRNIDIAGRYGGEEFLIILPQTNLNNGRQVGERIRRQVEIEGFEDSKEGITVSIGISQHQGEEMVDYIERADQLLYRAKRKGRNRIEC